MKFTSACVQLNCQNNMVENIAKAAAFITEASKQGADFIALPENAVFMSTGWDDLSNNLFYQEEHPALKEFQKLAKSLQKHILIGSLHIKLRNDEKIANRSFLIDSHGNISAQYDKIHLYDVSVKGGETHQESKRCISGKKPILAQTPWGKMGLTICYDVRFPYLYRNLAQAGAYFITVPAAFTKFTGEAHWHILLRARAIENSCYIIAPAQTGSHPNNRQTFGHSLIIDPWGRILADGAENEGIILAEIDTDLVEKTREQMPSLKHDKDI